MVMSGEVIPLLSFLCLAMGSVQSQGSSKDAFIIRFLEKRLTEIEERLNHCEQNTIRATQKTYDVATEIRGYVTIITLLRAEVERQGMRMERVEKELSLKNTLPTLSDIEIEDTLVEQQKPVSDTQLPWPIQVFLLAFICLFVAVLRWHEEGRF